MGVPRPPQVGIGDPSKILANANPAVLQALATTIAAMDSIPAPKTKIHSILGEPDRTMRDTALNEILNALLIQCKNYEPEPVRPITVFTEQDLRDIIQRLYSTARRPPVRTIAQKAGTSAASVSRVFNGARTTWKVLDSVIVALGGTRQDRERCKAVWESRRFARTPQPPAAPTASNTPAIEIHAGDVYISDAASVRGRTVILHDGNLFLTTEAANAAANIVVHGGRTHIGSRPAIADRDTSQQSHDEERPRLRPVG